MENTNVNQPVSASANNVPVADDIAVQISQAISSQTPKACLQALSLLSGQNAKQIPDVENSRKRLKVLAMPLLNTNDIATIFSNSLSTIFEYPVPDRLRVRLLSLPNDQRDEIKRQIENNLMANIQPFIGGSSISPSEWIARWLLVDQPVAEFAKYDPDYQKLSQADQLCVERLLSTYQLVSHSSATIEGVDEEIVMRDESGRLKVLRNGRVMELNSDRFEDSPAATVPPPIPPDTKPVAKSAPPPPPKVVMPPPTLPVVPEVPPAVKTTKLMPKLEPAITPAPDRQPRAKPTLPPRIPTVADKPKFFFHEEDEADIAKHRAKLANEASIGAANFSQAINQLVKDYGVELPDEQTRARFENIITSRFNDVRDLIETKAMLSRPTKIGGVGLPPEVVDQLTSQLEEQARLVHEAKSPPPPVEKPQVSEPPPPPTKVAPPPPEQPVVPVVQPVVPPKPPEKAKPVVVTATKKEPPAVKPPPVNSPPPPMIKRPIDGIRPVVSDIRPPTRVMGPIEELAALTIDDYRRLGRNLAESNDKVMEKLDLLEEESFLKRDEGVKAWKTSPAHKLYLSIGRASMEKNLAVADVIRQYNENGSNALTPQEFEALADLNKRISY